MPPTSDPTSRIPLIARILPGVFGLVFLGIGVTVIGFLWLAPFDAFGSPPLIFRLVGSFIAIAFVAVGGTLAAGALLAGRSSSLLAEAPVQVPPAPPSASMGASSPTAYLCTACGAPLSQKADVSPLGDVKCTHCGSWFNIHGRRA
jgi:DNA-directed RNA polymerase subunit RPC12/RpoP